MEVVSQKARLGQHLAVINCKVQRRARTTVHVHRPPRAIDPLDVLGAGYVAQAQRINVLR